MYQGHIVEQGNVLSIFENPEHPYTKGLLACRPRLESTFKVLPTVSDYLEETEVDGRVELSEKPNAFERIEELQKAVVDPVFDETDVLLEVSGLKVHFPERSGFFSGPKGWVKAVDGISFSVPRGSTLGLVGESGCGKTTTGRAILNLVPPTSGSVKFAGQEIAGFGAQAMLPLRKKMQIIFQDPYSSLNPRLTIEQALTEPMAVHGIGDSRGNRRDRAVALLEEVDLESRFLRRYPHEFSGGQRQRICVARALSLEPIFIVCDEAVSAMDVSVQAQVLNLLKELQARRRLTYIFISHDLSVVKFMADSMAVMRAGIIVEQGIAEAIYSNPKEDYTKRLIEAVPNDSVESIRKRVA
jgi:peptide/nickel transport system ATP-binding protein